MSFKCFNTLLLSMHSYFSGIGIKREDFKNNLQKSMDYPSMPTISMCEKHQKQRNCFSLKFCADFMSIHTLVVTSCAYINSVCVNSNQDLNSIFFLLWPPLFTCNLLVVRLLRYAKSRIFYQFFGFNFFTSWCFFLQHMM